MLWFQALNSRRFQHGVHRFNLNRPTSNATILRRSSDPLVQRRKLKLEASVESSL